MKLAGIDGCRSGWVVATADESLGSLEFAVVQHLDSLFAEAGEGAMVAIDIPIGLSEAGPRDCDRATRALLGFPRTSSVFPAPCRATLAAKDYRDACLLSAAAGGRRLSRQTYNILPKIRQVDRLLTPALQANVRECHPELEFAVLAGASRGLVRSKKTLAGEAERLALLHRFLPRFDAAAVRASLGLAAVGRDDIIDAAACLVAASRVATGRAVVLPRGDVPRDARGLRMEIVA